MKPTSIQFCGFGGQGIILSSVILGEAAVTKEGIYAAQSQSYGSEARGGQCQSEVVLSDEPIRTPTNEKNDILVAMFQAAYESHRHELKKGGMLFVDSGLVPDLGEVDPSITVWKVPATETAIALGSKMAGNMVMLGFIQEKTKLVSKENLLAAIKESVKEKFVVMNTAAFEEGIRMAKEDAGA
ncbi:MAG: 2-oxoacid:acceptor oxidoreductase family protein [Synergistaceae bacterium]|jgi:2-oxoglutarate ferredoxin oxidoreductase subunit gamma|uniref:2-oxoacid:acceptor oxidoreductase family protein n=1 Tax=Aminivibrio sp. TaxID=1872489 RepID=UPI0016A96B5D|nr:2-oxoacid:acceptor oxidoreductase family protein [Synergistaceae bacterium]NCC56942.1 ketoisovalerate oxidoreductase [Synergistales bacterium]MDD3389737.1 2-oxoacid:acceptor oxidoreductase family protein [Synergistaceae bacterium]MDD3689504.1 2-oxoacid:acceptor oxidoreductase family protein [Synergistaceae bacterium]MDD4020879.1 2-oxoacid:acceptor oxidoreductase family protein [Synergistaceae bacterium]